MKPYIITLTILFTLLFPTFLLADIAYMDGMYMTLPVNEDKAYYYQDFEASAYTLREEETDSSPFIGAMGTDLRFQDNTFASNILPLGTVIEYNGELWQNQDRMNRRYDGYNLDLCFKFDLKGAREFGRKIIKIKVYQ